MADPSATERDRIEELADSFMTSFRAGQRPSIDAYVQQYPELADQLRGLIAALIVLERNAPRRNRFEAPRVEPPLGGSAPREIGEFTIVREIGRGGMGVVYEAVQQSLGRHVALKVLSSGSLLNPTHLERFRLEARSAGRLHHSHIVPVFGVGESDGLHYFAMQFIPGQSLDQVIDALGKVRPGHDGDKTAPVAQDEFTGSIVGALLSGQFPGDSPADENGAGAGESPPKGAGDTPRAALDTSAVAKRSVTGQFSSGSSGRPFYESVARVGLQVAEALAYAHAEGILHRDIKPSNLLLDAKGNTWVTDFGLVKVDDSQALTETGDFVGTLRYMAPERLEGWSDRRSDIYGLGVTLYELLTLRTFFQSASRGQLIDSIRHEQPKPPTKIDPAVPRDLETIVLKALAKEPASRYPTAEAMAEDLRRFLADRPIMARRSTTRERFVRWCRRNPAVAALTAAVAMALVAGTIASTWQAIRATRAERLAEDRLRAEIEARQAADNARAAEAISHVSAAGPLWTEGHRDEAAEHYHAAVAILEKRARKFSAQSDDTRFFANQAIYLARIMASGARTKDVQETCGLCLRATEVLDGKLKEDDPIRRTFLAVAVRGYAERLRTDPERRAEAEQMMTWSTPIVEQTIKDVAFLDKLTVDRTAAVIDRHHACEAQQGLAKFLAWTNRAAEAEEMWLRAIRSFEAIDERFMIPFVLRDYRLYLTEPVEQLVKSGRADEAVKLVHKVIDAFDTLAAEHPSSAELYQAFQADTLLQLTPILVASGHAQQALAAARKSVDISEALTRAYPKNSEYRDRLANAQRVLAEKLAETGPHDD